MPLSSPLHDRFVVLFRKPGARKWRRFGERFGYDLPVLGPREASERQRLYQRLGKETAIVPVDHYIGR